MPGEEDIDEYKEIQNGFNARIMIIDEIYDGIMGFDRRWTSPRN